MSDTSDTNTSNTTQTAVHLEVVGSTSESGSSPSVRPGMEKSPGGSQGPIDVHEFVVRNYGDADAMWNIYLLQAWGKRGGFNIAAGAPISRALDDAGVSDAEARKRKRLLIGCGSNALFNPSAGDDAGTSVPLSPIGIKACRLENIRFLQRITSDVVLGKTQAGLSPTMYSQILKVLTDRIADGGNKLADVNGLVKWEYAVMQSMVSHEKTPVAMSSDELTLMDYFESWAKGRTEVIHAEVIGRLRGWMELSMASWKEHPTELAAIAHAWESMRQKTPANRRVTMDRLTTAFDGLADEQQQLRDERERLAGITPKVVNMAKNLGKKDEEKRQGRMVVVRDATRLTPSAAFDLKHDIVVAVKKDRGSGIFLNRNTTYGFNLGPAAEMTRFLIMAMNGNAFDAYMAWNKHQLVCPGEFPSLRGVEYNPASKELLINWDPAKLQANFPAIEGQLPDIAESSLNELGAKRWGRQKYREYLAVRRR